MTSRSRLLIPALRELGITDLFQYGIYQFGKRSGLLRRRTENYRWSDRPLESWLGNEYSLETGVVEPTDLSLREWTIDSRKRLQRFSSEDLRQEADEILVGKFRLFGGPPVPLGSPPDWGSIPLAGGQDSIPLDRHWTEYEEEGRQRPTASLGAGTVWLGIYPVSGLSIHRRSALCIRRYELISSWLENNPPNHGPHWISGQESALRILALIFAWYALADHLITSQAQAAQLLLALAVHADRIPPTLSYARAQRNNHLLSDAVGMYSVGLLMPWFKRSSEWKRLGRKWLIFALDDQVFDDGGYIQYSTNYQRLALSEGLWAARLAEIHDEPLPEPTLEGLKKMTEFLLSLTDPKNGRSLNWGHNDGSNILPLSAGQHADYRPLLQAAARAFMGTPSFGAGPWDEMSLWMGIPVGDEARDTRSARKPTFRRLASIFREMKRRGWRFELHTLKRVQLTPINCTWTCGGTAKTSPATPVPTAILPRRPGKMLSQAPWLITPSWWMAPNRWTGQGVFCG